MKNRINEINEIEVSQPRKLWAHLMIVFGTLIIAFSTIIIGLPITKLFGIKIDEMDASKFSPSVIKVSLFILLAVFYFIVVFISQRFIHKKPFRMLGFNKPAINQILIAFTTGVVINLIPFLIFIFTGKNFTLGSAIPADVSLFRVIIAFLFFFFIYLTVNSIGEELVFRTYPIEHLIDKGKLFPLFIIVVGMVFALLHFVVSAPSLNEFFRLTLTSIFYSMIYLNWRSIWVLVAIHNGGNFINLSFSENWEMGGLFTWTVEAMSGIGTYISIYRYVILIIAIILLYILYSRSKKY